MAFLDDLRAAVAGLQDPQGPAPAPVPQPSVPVPTTVPSAAPNAPPAYAPSDGPSIQTSPQSSNPHGLFGLHGTLRDVLGALGDGFLVNGGHNPVYAPRRLQERESAALSDFVANPMQGIQNLTQVNPQEATKLYGDVLTQQRQNRINDEQYQGMVWDRATRLLKTANENNYPQVRDMVSNYAQARGVQLPFELPQQYDEQAINDLTNTGVPTGQLNSQEMKELYQGQRIDYMNRNLGERQQYHQGVLQQGGRRLDQGDIRVQNDTRRTDQGDVRVQNDTTRTDNNTTRTDQGQEVIDQYTAGDRGTPMSRRPRPGTIFVKTGPDGKKMFGRQVGVDKNGKPIIQPLN